MKYFVGGLYVKQLQKLCTKTLIKVFSNAKKWLQERSSTTHRVRTGPAKTWKVLEIYFDILQNCKALEKLLVLESSGNLLNSSKKYEMCGRQ